MVSPLYVIFSTEATHLRKVLQYLEKQSLVAHWWRIGLELELTYGDLEVIKCNSDSVEYRASGVLNQWPTTGKATKQALYWRLCRWSNGTTQMYVLHRHYNTMYISIYNTIVCNYTVCITDVCFDNVHVCC